MPGSIFGKAFQVSTWGESHGRGVGAVIDGCPPRIPLDERYIQAMMDKRKPGQSAASTTRKEEDRAVIMSGVFEGMTTGTPIMIMIKNKDAKSDSYKPFANLYRPGHGDFTYQKKYGVRDWRGGGRASARETAGRVAAGAVAKAVLEMEKIKVTAYTLELGGVRAKGIRAKKNHLDSVYENPYLCPDPDAAVAMDKRVCEIRQQGDSIGGIVEIIASGVPAGLGDPVFDKLDAELARGLMSIGAVKGVEIGAGFEAAVKTGSTNNDPVLPEGFASNHAGGILAGISNGDDLVMRVAVKPIPSISIEQTTIDINNQPETIRVGGRHDISAIPRINVVCEAMVYLVLADHLLRQRSIQK
ncbi:chorismate synthase [Desulfobacterales bacterium HSG16]|nr:chorismate synthase [Desulfobacterales bacterium HSG16]